MISGQDKRIVSSSGFRAVKGLGEIRTRIESLMRLNRVLLSLNEAQSA